MMQTSVLRQDGLVHVAHFASGDAHFLYCLLDTSSLFR